jgi:hypothetical protein
MSWQVSGSMLALRLRLPNSQCQTPSKLPRQDLDRLAENAALFGSAPDIAISSEAWKPAAGCGSLAKIRESVRSWNSAPGLNLIVGKVAN